MWETISRSIHLFVSVRTIIHLFPAVPSNMWRPCRCWPSVFGWPQGLCISQGRGVLKVNLRAKNLCPLLILGLIQPVLYFIFETIGIALTSAPEASIVVALILRLFRHLRCDPLERTAKVDSACVCSRFHVRSAPHCRAEASGEAKRQPGGLLILLGAPICAACFTVLS